MSPAFHSGVVVPPAGYEEIQEWVDNNAQLRAMHEIAIEDYIAARYSVLGLGLFTVGFALAAQSIEKLLKCYLMLGGAQLADMKNFSHKLESLFHAAVSCNAALQARQVAFGSLCSKLHAWYQSRYPCAPNSASEWVRADFAQVDEMVVYLEEHMPLPTPVISLLYAGGSNGFQWNSIFVRLFHVLSDQHRHALLLENAELQGRLPQLFERFLEARKTYLLPAQTAQESAQRHQQISQDLAALIAKSRC